MGSWQVWGNGVHFQIKTKYNLKTMRKVIFSTFYTSRLSCSCENKNSAYEKVHYEKVGIFVSHKQVCLFRAQKFRYLRHGLRKLLVYWHNIYSKSLRYYCNIRLAYFDMGFSPLN